MVICQYFLNNMCRFGTKCNNEHVNVRLTLKTDAEGALRGNQWPISSYGPFRDKPSIVNFIEDQSFEEIRHLCYEAKNTGNIHVVTQQFAQQINDAKNKMNMLVNPSNEIVTMVTNLYNSSGGGAPSATNANPPTSNPFSMDATNNSTGNGLFGAPSSSSVTSNPFASNAAGFGANSNAQNTPNIASIFGAPQPQAPSTGSIFGGATVGTEASAPTNSCSIFGSSGFGSNNTNSLFSNASTNKPSIFGAASANTAFGAASTTNPPSSNIFGGGTQASSVFGGPATFGSNASTSIFGSSSLAQPANSNIFAQSSNAMPTFGGMAAQQQQQPQPQQSFFGASAGTGGSSIFGQPAQPAQNAGNIFGASQPAQPMPSTNIFGGQSAAQSSNIFGAPQPSNEQSNIFGTPAPALTQNQSIFGASSFQQPQQQQQMQQPQSSSLYSSIDALTAEELAAFNATTFEMGLIPMKPPPRELCA